MSEMKVALGTHVDMTVFRKLRSLGYCSSYSHGGKFYTLLGNTSFDERGLWSGGDVRFSEFGSLVATAERFVLRSKCGVVASELARDLGVECKGALLQLVQEKRISRVRAGRQYVYCSGKKRQQRKQMAARELLGKRDAWGFQDSTAEYSADEVQAAAILLMGLLNEKQRRLFAGFESLRVGKGGDRSVSEWLHVSRRTVVRGRKELTGGKIDVGRIRKGGGGRKSSKKNARADLRN